MQGLRCVYPANACNQHLPFVPCLILLLQGLRCVYPANARTQCVEVLADDLNRLGEEEFLNDTIIDFYLK